ncbi:MAG TPA: ABC transporter permease [Bacillota bacterium]|jgi:osmoprotectant transport system permease protein|nr:ABC transporter permease [Bacillota bacterium]HOJ83096.1 ABC transporter permease [Bacillota bacterium]HOL15262.1 ABC transporter permease [Bacillota bacterium]HPZ11247.1 ABC transporter permease [Bacillota bacterium]HQE09323.1 ABC transporter permease [Bacillota bacterium]
MRYILQHPDLVLKLTLEHIQISAISVIISLVIGVIIGIILTRVKFLQAPVIGLAGVLYTIPALALFAMLIPFMGLGLKPTVFALILYSQLAIVRNTVSGIETIDPSIIEVAKGMGMTGWQRLFMVELPLGLPVIMAGVRMVTVMAIGVATIASFISAGGLGDLIYLGMQTVDLNIIFAGALPLIILTLGADAFLVFLQRKLERWREDLSARDLAGEV